MPVVKSLGKKQSGFRSSWRPENDGKNNNNETPISKSTLEMLLVYNQNTKVHLGGRASHSLKKVSSSISDCNWDFCPPEFQSGKVFWPRAYSAK